jgi:hypothetical protein
MVGNITQENRDRREKLVNSYNLAKKKETKLKRYEKLMEFEERMLRLGHNG